VSLLAIQMDLRYGNNCQRGDWWGNKPFHLNGTKKKCGLVWRRGVVGGKLRGGQIKKKERVRKTKGSHC